MNTPAATQLAEAQRLTTTLFHRLRAQVRSALDRQDPALRMTSYRILSALRHTQAVAPGELAAHLELDRAVISREIDHLDSLKLVTITTDPADRRGKLVSPTTAGTDLVAKLRSDSLKGLSKVSPEDLDTFIRVLRVLNADLGADSR